MPATGLLRKSFHHLGATQAFHKACHPARLADKAYAAETAAGVVLNPRHSERTSFLRYYSAHPVAPWTQGARKAGFAASAYWGASLTTSLLRNEGPAFWLWYYACGHNDALARPAGNGGRRNGGVSTARSILQGAEFAAFTAPLALCASEVIFGTGALNYEPGPQANENFPHANTLELIRAIGCGGYLERRLLAKAEGTTGLAATGYEAAALGVRLLMVPGRIVNAHVLAATALLGCCIGVVYETVAQLSFAVRHAYARRFGVARVVSFTELLRQEEARNLEELRVLDDTQIPAPFIRALWLPVRAGVADNRRVAAAVGQANQAGIDVHAPGRDPATRRALAHLLALYAEVDEAASITDLLQRLVREQLLRGPLERRRHETGVSILTAAKRALGIDAGARIGFAAILAPDTRHSVLLDDGTRIPVQRVCATVWHAIARLREGDGTDERRNVKLREERQEAFIVAVADVLAGDNSRVCAAGQVQRMVLVLQGCLEGMEVEDYERVPSVAQMVSYLYQQLATELPDGASPQHVAQQFDRAYQQGIQRLPEPQHAAFGAELTALAQMDHDLAWAPRLHAAA